MFSQIVNESLITNIINNRESNNEEKIKSILQLFIVLLENKQQMINDQAKLILSHQKFIELIQENGESKKKVLARESEEVVGNNKIVNKDLIELNDYENHNGDIKPLYKVFIGQLPQNIPIVQIKNHLNEIFGHVDSVYKLIPESNYGFALFSNYESCQKALSRGSIKFQDKSFYLHNAHDRENNS